MAETWEIAVFFSAVVVYIIGMSLLYWITSDDYKLRKTRKKLGYDTPGLFSALKLCCVVCIGPINRKRWESKHKYYRTDDYGPPDSKWMEIKPPTERNQEWQRLPRGDTERHKAIISKALPIITDNVAELEYVDLIDRTASQLGRRDTRNSNNTPTKVPKSTLEKGNLRQQALARKETAPAKPQRPQSQHLADTDLTPYEMTLRRQKSQRRQMTKSVIELEPRTSNNQLQPSTNPLTIEGLRSIVATMNEASFIDEYLAIPTHLTKPSIYSSDKQQFNRDERIVPNPKTRVRIDPPKGVTLRTDFINANLVRGHNTRRPKYIAAQGPLSGHEDQKVCTREHFWTMIWNYQVPVIVMMIPPSAHRCPPYWPTSSTSQPYVFGPFSIRHINREIVGGISKTILSLRCKGSRQEHIVTHFLNHHWPAEGVPTSTSGILSLINKAHEAAKGPGPIVIHDDLGIGPSGVFIVGAHLIRQINDRKMVDIPKLLSLLRLDRGGLVQSLAEYQFLYKIAAVHSVTSVSGAGAPPPYTSAPHSRMH
eukprot:gene2062-5121_t